MEPEFYRMAPRDVTIHSARMRLLDFTPKALLKMVDDVRRGAELLSSARVDIIIYGCSTCSLVGGVDWGSILVDQIKFETGIEVLTVNKAVVEALNSLGDGNIGVVTPYDSKLNRLERDYLETHGLKVSSLRGLGLRDPMDICSVEEESVLDLVDQVLPDADLVYISCTNLPVIQLIERIEEEVGIPVVTSNQAALYAALKIFNIDNVRGYGTLFSK